MDSSSNRSKLTSPATPRTNTGLRQPVTPRGTSSAVKSSTTSTSFQGLKSPRATISSPSTPKPVKPQIQSNVRALLTRDLSSSSDEDEEPAAVIPKKPGIVPSLKLNTSTSQSSDSRSTSSTTPTGNSNNNPRDELKRRKSELQTKMEGTMSDTVKAIMEQKQKLMDERAKQRTQKQEESSNETIKELLAKIAALTTRNKVFESEIKELKDSHELQLQKLELELENAKMDKEIAEADLEELKESINLGIPIEQIQIPTHNTTLEEEIDVELEAMVEELTEKNLILGEKVMQLEETVAEYEEYKNLQIQVEHYNEELIKDLRNELICREEELDGLEAEIQSAKMLLKEKDLLINRFRVKVVELTREIAKLQRAQQSEESEISEYKNRTNNLLVTYHNLQEKVKKMKTSTIEQEIQSAVMKSNVRLLEDIQKYLPEKVMEEDIRSVQALRVIDLVLFELEIVVQSVCEEKNVKHPENEEATIHTPRELPTTAEFTSQELFQSHFMYFINLSRHIMENFKNSNLTGVPTLIKLGRFLNELQDAEQNVSSIIYAVKNSELNEKSVQGLLKDFKDHLERIYSTVTVENLTWGSLSYVVLGIVNLSQDANDILTTIQNMSDRLISESERSNANKISVKELFNMIRQDKEEHMQLVQMYRKLHKLCQEHKYSKVPPTMVNLLHQCIVYGVLSFVSVKQRLEQVQRIKVDKEMDLIKEVTPKLKRELTSAMDFEDFKSPQNFEEISLEDSITLTMWVLRVPTTIVQQVRSKIISRQEFLASEPLQDASNILIQLCDYLSELEPSDVDSIENPLINKRSEDVRVVLGSHETLLDELDEAENQVVQLTTTKESLEEKLETVLKRKESLEQELKELQRKDREYLQMEEKVKNLDRLKKELDNMKHNESELHNLITDLKLQLETMEQRNYVLQQQLGSTKVSTLRDSSILMEKATDLSTGGDQLDRTELLALKSAVRIMRKNKFREIALRNENIMRKLMDSDVNKVAEERQSLNYLGELRGFTKELASLEPKDLVLHVVDLKNTKQKGSVEYQWIKQCKSYEQFQDKFSKFHGQIASSLLQNQVTDLNITTKSKVGQVTFIQGKGRAVESPDLPQKHYQLLVNKKSLQEVFQSLISY